jgi:hypothetical protein
VNAQVKQGSINGQREGRVSIFSQICVTSFMNVFLDNFFLVNIKMSNGKEGKAMIGIDMQSRINWK